MIPTRKRSRIGIAPWVPMAILIAVVAGCATVGPDYLPPRTTLSADWSTSLPAGLKTTADPTKLAVWWKNLSDPDLSGLMERAQARNHDLKKAGARIREARARRGLSRTGLYPVLDASGSATRSSAGSDTGIATTRDLFAAGLDASWEIDWFGGVRRSVEAADANLAAAGEELHDTLVSLLAEVALNYVDLRLAQARLSITENSLRTQEETRRLTLWRAEAGLGDELAVSQATYALESARAQIPTLSSAIAESKNRLAVLLGETPGKLDRELETPKPIPAIPGEVAIGVPADLLRQRPDIRMAERNLASQTAQIGVAQAELYPKFKLSGTIGVEASNIGGLFSAGNATSSGSAGITWRVFDAGAIRRNIEIQSALQEQSLIAYESAVLAALEEAENAISAFVKEQKRRQSLAEAAKAAQTAAELAGIKYKAGLAEFSIVLEAERSLLNLRDQLAQSEGAIVTNLVKLYKALGGGWTPLQPIESKRSMNGAKS